MVRFLFLIVCGFSISLYSKLSEKVVICGVCRDVESRLPYMMRMMESVGGLFEDYRIIIYENNSKDHTKKILKIWGKKNSKVLILSEDCTVEELEKVTVNRDTSNQFTRAELIARARNIVLDTAMSNKYTDYSHLLWMDMDFISPPSLEGIVEVFKSDKEWDGVFANGITRGSRTEFWDWYALRDKTYPLGPELLGNSWWFMPKQLELGSERDWYPVYSAFGGFGIYKKSSIVDCRYSAVVTEDLEIVAKKIIEEGKSTGHPQVFNYLALNRKLNGLVKIPLALPNLPKVEDPNTGIILHPNFQDPVIWRMSTSLYYYPSVCEHVTFHASMIARGHDKLFINPRLVFYYE